MARARKDDAVSLDDLNPFDLEGTPADIALVERGLAIMARKQVVWASVVEGWKKRAGIPTNASDIPPTAPPKDARQSGEGTNETVADLVSLYRSDERSPYHKLRYRTKGSYESLLRRVIEDCGDRKLIELKALDIQSLYDGWTGRGMAIARALVTMLRMLFGFGATILEDPQCERLSVVLHKMRFEMAQPRSERLTRDHAIAVRNMAHEKGLHSIALAQAFQFDCELSQKDVIGEWLPNDEPSDETDIYDSQGNKWLRGIRWSEIDQNRILRHTSSRGQKDIEINLNRAPMVMEEFRRLGDLPPSGPVVVSEHTELPYTAHEFRRRWRIIARAAGVPDNVYNMDSRAGSENQPL